MNNANVVAEVLNKLGKDNYVVYSGIVRKSQNEYCFSGNNVKFLFNPNFNIREAAMILDSDVNVIDMIIKQFSITFVVSAGGEQITVVGYLANSTRMSGEWELATCSLDNDSTVFTVEEMFAYYLYKVMQEGDTYYLGEISKVYAVISDVNVDDILSNLQLYYDCPWSEVMEYYNKTTFDDSSVHRFFEELKCWIHKSAEEDPFSFKRRQS